MNWYWISFADEDAFLGVAVVDAADEKGAIEKTHELKINPGGEALILLLQKAHVPPASHSNRLLTKAETEQLSIAMTGGGIAHPDFPDDAVTRLDGAREEGG